MKVLWLANIPSPYRVDFFNEIGKHCELTVLFEKKVSDERDESWMDYKFLNFKGVILKGKSTGVDNAFCPGVFNYLKKKKYDINIVTNYSTPTGIFAIEIMKAKNISYIIEGDGGFTKSKKGVKENIKRHLIKNATYWFSTSDKHKDYYLSYGAIEKNIYKYPFTSIKEKDILKSSISKVQKDKIKNKLRIKEERVILSVGQLIYRKGYDILIEAAQKINNDIGIYIIGGNPSDELLALKKNLNVENVYFIDFKSKEELKNYYYSADLFVLPTREDIWGLVINEAMAYGLPVITTDKCISGLELVVNYENGFIIPTNDSLVLSEKITEIFENNNLIEKMSKSNRVKIMEYTIESMAEVHLNYFKKILRNR
ncbi:MAG: hypothetical protein PWR19_1965 [Carnobacterium sp.]|uniref:glycosyltransferase family 4 protein n=1 Tax=Carnobacterium sp. TaxID=48221 RepID=UPI002647012F|nr:glycosyltransferase family 4 protein [Carnobacterium sp.]MDN5372919.1 hypothetical protein [Carnobacterium sp.]